MKYLVIGSILSAAWLVLSFVMEIDLADSLIAAAIGSAIVAAPVVLAVVLHIRNHTSLAYLFDLTALLYAGVMIWVYIDLKHSNPDPQGPVALVVYPVMAGAILGVESIVLQLWSHRSTRDSR